MIDEPELKTLARTWNVQEMVVDLDYSLGWFLQVLRQTRLGEQLVFKGGTCLRKCYFPDYRFSEDLDFTLLRAASTRQLQSALDEAVDELEREGFEFPQLPKVEALSDDYGKISLQARVYFRGVLQFRGQPRAIRLDLNQDEVLLFPAVERALHHPYSDAAAITARWACYDLREVLAEKLRAICGQRRYAISRDLYDIAFLIGQGVETGNVLEALPSKFAVKDVPLDTGLLPRLDARRPAFEADWQRSVAYLVRPELLPEFEEVWECCRQLVEQIEKRHAAS